MSTVGVRSKKKFRERSERSTFVPHLKNYSAASQQSSIFWGCEVPRHEKIICERNEIMSACFESVCCINVAYYSAAVSSMNDFMFMKIQHRFHHFPVELARFHAYMTFKISEQEE